MWSGDCRVVGVCNRMGVNRVDLGMSDADRRKKGRSMVGVGRYGGSGVENNCECDQGSDQDGRS